jgi:urease accessory protein
LVINKIDIASFIGADLSIMERDAKIVRNDKPYVFVNSKTGQGVKTVAEQIVKDVLFDAPPKSVAVN